MSRRTRPATAPLLELIKCLSGIRGLDEIISGGIPRKTLLAMEFLVPPGVFICFEELKPGLALDEPAATEPGR